MNENNFEIEKTFPIIDYHGRRFIYLPNQKYIS